MMMINSKNLHKLNNIEDTYSSLTFFYLICCGETLNTRALSHESYQLTIAPSHAIQQYWKNGSITTRIESLTGF